MGETIERANHKYGIAWDHLQKYGYLNNRVAGGFGHTAAILHNGEVRACGGNAYGPCNVEDWQDVKQIVCSSVMTFGLKNNGQLLFTGKLGAINEIVSGGRSEYIAEGTPLHSWSDNLVSVAACTGSIEHVLGLTADGKVLAYGSNCNGQCNVNDWCDIVEITAQLGYSAGVKKDGTVIACGKDDIKQGVALWKNIEHIFGNSDYLMGLKNDGTVVYAGKTDYFDSEDFVDWENIIYISAGISNVAGITGDGKVFFAGNCNEDLLRNGLNNIVWIDVESNLVAVCNDGSVYIGSTKEYSKMEMPIVFSKSGFMTKIIVSLSGHIVVILQEENLSCGQDACSNQWQLFVNEEANQESESTPTQQTQIPQSTQSSSSGCYIATCVYGSYDCPEVWTLRRFRDDTLASTALGRAFIRTYYAISPTLVKWFGERGWFRSFWGKILDKMVSKLNSDGVENTPYDDKDWN